MAYAVQEGLQKEPANKILAGPTTGADDFPTYRSAVAADIPNLDAAKITTGKLALARGGTNADLSGTGGTSQVLRQSSAAAAITVGQLAASDLSNGTTGSGLVVLAIQAAAVNVTPVTVTANVNTDQNLMAATVSANSLNSVGRTLKLWGAGLYTTPALSVATLTVKIKLGSVTLATFTSSANAGLVTDNAWNFQAFITTQTAGASAVFEVHGNLMIDLGATPGLADSVFSDVNTAVSSAVDSTTSQTLQITVAFSAASASNAATQRQMIGEFIN